MPPPPPVPLTGLGRLRKIALVGSAETVEHAPWYDHTWEIWTHSVTIGRCKRITRVFEMHPEHVWRDHTKPQWPTYLKWLQHCQYPLYMLEKHHDIPSSVRYPRERIFGEFDALGEYVRELEEAGAGVRDPALSVSMRSGPIEVIECDHLGPETRAPDRRER